MTDRELMRQGLEALTGDLSNPEWDDLITALQERLAQPEQEPVAWMQEMPTKGDETRSVRLTTVEALAREEWGNPIPLYTAPPRREWVYIDQPEFDRLQRYFGDNIGGLFVEVQKRLRERNQ